MKRGPQKQITAVLTVGAGQTWTYRLSCNHVVQDSSGKKVGEVVRCRECVREFTSGVQHLASQIKSNRA